MSAANYEQPPRFLLHNAPDIKRLSVHLVTHWELPRVEFSIDGLHTLHSQRAQDRFTRLSGRCNCLIGEVLGATTLVGGIIIAWASNRGWRDMGLVVFATVCAALAGKGIELVWTRVKLLQVLRGLRRRLSTPEGSPERDVERIAVTPVAGKPFSPASMADDDDAVHADRIQRPVARDRPGRPKVTIRNVADMDRLIPRLAVSRKLPRIEISIDGLSALDTQRAQTRIVRLSNGCTYMLAGVLAALVLLSGLFHAVWTASRDWLYSESEAWWLMKLDWRDVQPVVLATLCAALVGITIEWVWMRARLLLVLRGLRDQIR